MKFLLLLFAVLTFSSATRVEGQATDIPQFTVLRSNGRYFSTANLPTGKPVLLIYFSTDCGHCTTLLQDVFKNSTAFQKLSVLLVTFKPIEELRAFEQRYQTAQHTNVTVGTEGTSFKLRYFYRIEKMPFAALYNAQGKLLHTYRNEPSAAVLARDAKPLLQ